MKTIKLLISIILVATALILVDSCKGKGDDPGPGPDEDTEVGRVTGLLASGTWKISSVTVDGVAKNMFTGLTLTFDSRNILAATKGEPVWPTSGSWSFTDDTATAITLGNQTAVGIDAIDENKLTLSLNWTKTTIGPGRVSSIAGKHVFVFGK
jgi:hypothetical protein